MNGIANGTLDLLYLAPERLFQQQFLEWARQQPWSMLAIDEAHCVSMWGHDFRPEYARIGELRGVFPNTPVLALTATADHATRDDILRQLHMQDPTVLQSSYDRPNIFLEVRQGIDRTEQIIAFVRDRPEESGIVYTRSRNGAEQVFKRLKAAGISAGYYHAGLQAHEREQVSNAFFNDEIQVICATVAFGMGIDKPDIRFVLHYNISSTTLESFYQKTGRAGRDGAPAHTLLFYTFADVARKRQLIEQEGGPRAELLQTRLDRMTAYAETADCRRQALLQYFGEELPKPCGYCDNCQNPPERIDGTELAQKALSAVIRCKSVVTLPQLIDVLRGSRSQTILQRGWDKIKTYGLGSAISARHWQHYLLQMLTQGVLEMHYTEGFRLSVPDKGREVLSGDAQVLLARPAGHATDAKTVRKKREKRSKAWQTNLLGQLRRWRAEQAKTIGIAPAELIAEDKLEKLSKKPVFMPNALYAARIMPEAHFAAAGEALALFLVEQYPTMLEDGGKPKGGSDIATFLRYQAGEDVQAIATERGISPLTVLSHLAKCHAGGLPVNAYDFVSDDEVAKVQEAYEAGNDSLGSIRTALNKDIEYGQIVFALTLLGIELPRG